VGTGDDWGNGLFYSWFGPPNAPSFAMADSYDGDTPRQKLTYETPSFAGFKGGISYQPNDVAINLSTNLTNGNPSTGAGTWDHPTGLARNRIEAAVQYINTFGPFGVKADVGGAWSGVESSYGGPAYQNVSYGNGGVVLTYAGFEFEGSASVGHFNAWCGNDAVAGSCTMSPGDPAPAGSKDSAVWTVGFGYNSGPYSLGFSWYDMNFDDLQAGGAVGGHMDHSYGPGIGGSYVVGPGVTLQLDAYTYKTQYYSHPTTNGNIIAFTGVFAY
jgi:predicted porin